MTQVFEDKIGRIIYSSNHSGNNGLHCNCTLYVYPERHAFRAHSLTQCTKKIVLTNFSKLLFTETCFTQKKKIKMKIKAV